MSEFDAHNGHDPDALVNDPTLREAFRMLAELRKAGFASGDYDLAPSFGGSLPNCEQSSLTSMRAIYFADR